MLDEAHLKTGFSLAEARILYELANGEGITASVLSRTLGLDPGYLSRILRGFEDRGLLTKTPSDSDGRRSYLELTADGFVAFETIDTVSQQNIANLISPLGDEQQYRLLESMRTIEQLLADPAAAAMLSDSSSDSVSGPVSPASAPLLVGAVVELTVPGTDQE